MSKKSFAVIIKPLCDLYGEPQNWGEKIRLYYKTLSDIPESILDHAVTEHMRSSVFFPKPAELRAAVAHELAEHRRRLRESFAAAQALPAPEDVPPSEEDKAHVEAVMAEFRAAVAGRSGFIKGGEA